MFLTAHLLYVLFDPSKFSALCCKIRFIFHKEFYKIHVRSLEATTESNHFPILEAKILGLSCVWKPESVRQIRDPFCLSVCFFSLGLFWGKRVKLFCQ